jgi:hypothetical protein
MDQGSKHLSSEERGVIFSEPSVLIPKLQRFWCF